jgi:hypothetical protein
MMYDLVDVKAQGDTPQALDMFVKPFRVHSSLSGFLSTQLGGFLSIRARPAARTGSTARLRDRITLKKCCDENRSTVIAFSLRVSASYNHPEGAAVALIGSWLA